MAKPKEIHSIRIPGSILDQIRNREESGVYDEDTSRFGGPTKKRKKETGTRKDLRKAERETKKRKRSQKTEKPIKVKPKEKKQPVKLKGILKPSKPVAIVQDSGFEDSDSEISTATEFSDEGFSEGEELTEEATWEALAKLKASKMPKAPVHTQEELVSESEIESGSFEEFGDSEDDWAEFESDNDPETVDDTYAALAALKAKKSKNLEEPKKETKDAKMEKAEKAEKPGKSKKQRKEKSLTKAEVYDDPSILDGVDDDLDYYAKKLGTKASARLDKAGDDDIIGGLLDGLDLDFGDENAERGDSESDGENPFSSDDEINESDFDDEEFDEEDRELLREMEEVEDDSGSEDDGPKIKENPYIAPGARSATSKYVPPALRRLQNSSDHSEELKKITRSIRGPLNRMSETTIPHTVNELNGTYNDNPRQLTTEAFTNLILETVSVPNRLLDNYVMLYSCITVALFKLQGPDFGAHILQTAVEKLERFFTGEVVQQGKESLNLMAFLSYSYNFGLFGSKLIYDIVEKRLIAEINELNIELLLKVVKTCGTKMRTDDPSSLKEIILSLTKKVTETEKSTGIKAAPRARFLIDTVTNLKNNKIRDADDESSSNLFVRLKKAVGSIKGSASSEVMQVSFQDILDVDKKGKWWLVGAAWKGNDKTEDEPSVNINVMEDYLDSAEPNWLELAKEQRMNTDIRRAIFVSIMSANDFMDSFDKLEKLQLKKQQEREIINIVLHCVSMETVYNPYYGFLAKKLCEKHSLKKTFQFNLWDFLKDLEDEDEGKDELTLDTGALENDSLPLHKILNTGRLFGFLIAQGCLPLNVLRTVNFLTASTNTKLFVEILLISYFDQIANASKKHSSKMHAAEAQYDERELLQSLGKCKEQPVLLKGLQFFIQDTIAKSDLIKGKHQKKRVAWASQTMSDMIELMAE
ncbi:unnamed protein product [Kuraishia capsulata CBS 1993]|uniref:MI domain-containing protein n=1 Tax=Kuraishia capsulata CBS 1993 TaxID=1382522 RepID=W6MML1_9ASCO|nr:uncharacterized protein KUCA_T00003421001 [Kuraishia capsulata CBS 1993]CDK27443.1 unnamed protein product [Kuraishia capsulata CBS 1993]